MGQLTIYKHNLSIRDGKECWYCGRELPKDELTVEHLLARIHGGTDNINNLVLADVSCNKEAGHMPIAYKVKLRERKRGLNVSTA